MKEIADSYNQQINNSFNKQIDDQLVENEDRLRVSHQRRIAENKDNARLVKEKFIERMNIKNTSGIDEIIE